MDLHTILVIVHVVGTILGVGGATLAEVQLVTALRNGAIDASEKALMHANYTTIRVGTLLVLVSGFALVWWHVNQGNFWVFTSDKVWFKDLLILFIIFNAIFLSRRWIPLWLGSAISFTAWWMATILGLWRYQPFSFFELLVGFAGITLIVAWVLHQIRSFFIPKKTS